MKLRVVNSKGRAVTCASCVHLRRGPLPDPEPGDEDVIAECTWNDLWFSNEKHIRAAGCTWHQRRKRR
jgi:hypothetical protein